MARPRITSSNTIIDFLKEIALLEDVLRVV